MCWHELEEILYLESVGTWRISSVITVKKISGDISGRYNDRRPTMIHGNRHKYRHIM